MTKFPEVFAKLAEPFHPSDIKVRDYDKARYVTARTVMNKLDDVLGPENWSPDYKPFGADSVICQLTITLPDGSKVTKSDVGSNTSMAKRQGGKCDPGEDDKGGTSDALKRAAVAFGVGRHLYNDGVPDYRPEAEPPAKATPPRVEPKARPADPDSRPFAEYAEAAAKAADVDFAELLDDVIENLSEDGRIPTKLRDRDQKVRDVSDYYQHNRGTVQAMVKGLVKDYRKQRATEGNGVR